MRYQGIKVTVITGFLGAGKTTLIRHLLSQAPPYERWAVLVNEFGEIGLDGAFLQASVQPTSQFAIKEVPGGCVCCTTSTAFNQGLNQLIKQHNPDRILIEPSGLGHPRQIIEQLRSGSYQNVLLVTGVFCVLDGRHLSDERYTQHALFNDQIHVANAVVMSHMATYQASDHQAIECFFAQKDRQDKPCFATDPMALSVENLDLGLAGRVIPSTLAHEHEHEHEHEHTAKIHVGSAGKKFDAGHYVKQQDGMKVVGWQWQGATVFNEKILRDWLDSVINTQGVYRIKGVFLVANDHGLFVNVSNAELSIELSYWSENSRLEVIGLANSNWERYFSDLPDIAVI